MKKYVIGGIFVERSLTGVARYCWELIRELDILIDNKDICVQLLVPNGVDVDYNFKNIEVVNYAKSRKFFWYNISLPLYILKNKAVGIHLAVQIPWIKPDIVCIHDVNTNVNPQFFSKYHVIKTKFEKWLAVKFARKIIAVSEFSKHEINKYIGERPDTVVVYNAWQHMKNIDLIGTSSTLFGVSRGEYFFSMSSIAPTKNFKWIIEAAKQNPNEKFIIAGGIDPKTFGVNGLNDEIDNVKYIGRITDEEAKVLMRDCKAFIFPSFYEGFGIPPLEALACGAPHIIVSDIPVMHEVYGDSAHYINPYDYRQIDLNRIINSNISDSSNTLEKYSWKKSAQVLLDLLMKD